MISEGYQEESSMRTNDEALLKIKYTVLHEVAKLAFSGELD